MYHLMSELQPTRANRDRRSILVACRVPANVNPTRDASKQLQNQLLYVILAVIRLYPNMLPTLQIQAICDKSFQHQKKE